MESRKVQIVNGANACPFCFNADNLVGVSEGEDWYVECRTCAARGPIGANYPEAVDLWGNDMGIIDMEDEIVMDGDEI